MHLFINHENIRSGHQHSFKLFTVKKDHCKKGVFYKNPNVVSSFHILQRPRISLVRKSRKVKYFFFQKQCKTALEAILEKHSSPTFLFPLKYSSTLFLMTWDDTSMTTWEGTRTSKHDIDLVWDRCLDFFLSSLVKKSLQTKPHARQGLFLQASFSCMLQLSQQV